MTAFSGILDDFKVSNGWGSSDLSASSPSFSLKSSVASESAGAKTAVTFIPSTSVKSGSVDENFGALWDQTIVLPKTKVFGNIASEQTYNIEIWNTSRSVAKSLNEIQISGQGGLQIAGSAPAVVAPGGSKNYTATIPATGSASIANTATWNGGLVVGSGPSPAFSVSHTVTGMRIILFPFTPNWSSGLRETVEYLTDILTARSGAEQRSRRRILPRRSMEFEAAALSSLEAQTLDMMLTKSQGMEFAVPWWQDAIRFNGTLAAGSTQAAIDTTNRIFKLAPLIMIWSGAGAAEVQSLNSVSSSLLTFSALSATYTNPMLVPAFPGRLDNEVQVSRRTTRFSQLPAKFACEVGVSDPRPAPAAMSQAYGFDVLTAQPKWNDPKHTIGRNLQRLDDGAGPISVLDLGDLSFQKRDFVWLADSKAAAQMIRDFVDLRAGRQTPFWVPTWHEDLTLVQVAPAVAQGIVVANCGYTASAFPNNFRRYLAIRLPAGGWMFRKVTSASSAGSTETLTLDAVLGTQLPIGTQVSFLTLCRLDSDSVQFGWHNQNVAEVSMVFAEVPREVPA